MKGQVRVLGIDDAPFRFKEGRVPIVGALLRGPSYLEAVLTSSVAVDGDDADNAVIGMLNRSRYREQMSLVMLDGIALGGFNVLDIRHINRETGLPLVTVTRDRPDLGAIEEALRKHFIDWERRLEIIKASELIEVSTKHSPIYVSSIGMDVEDMGELVRLTTVQGSIPEPLRVAHLIATALVRGESHGRP